MIWNVLKMFWAIWITITCMHYCSVTHVPIVYSQEFLGDGGKPYVTEDTPPPISKKLPIKITVIDEYVVVKGDTLGDIADKHGTTWEKLWALNKDRITDPNLIHIGQRVRIIGKVVPEIPKLTREEKIDKLSRFMFKTSQIKFEEINTCKERLGMDKNNLVFSKVFDLDNQREIVNRIYYTTRQLEIWILSESIVDTSTNDDDFYRLVGLAWQESQFISRLGKHKEVSFFQFLPSTIKQRFQLDDIGLENKLWELRNNPKKAAELALEMMTEYKWQWKYWNGGLDYEYHLNNKIYSFKHTWNRR